MERIADCVESTESIPKEIAHHARECDECLFWLSHALAIEKAYYTVSRYQERKSACPSREAFRALLISGARTLYTLQKIISKKDKRSMSRIQHLTIKESRSQFEIWNHLNAPCTLCGFYYDDLFDYMLTAQERYEKELKIGNSIVPVTTGPAQDIDVPKPGIVLPSPGLWEDNKKPN